MIFSSFSFFAAVLAVQSGLLQGCVLYGTFVLVFIIVCFVLYLYDHCPSASLLHTCSC